MRELTNQLQALSDIQIRSVLVSEGRKLERIVKKVWSRYANSYTPKQYIRTGNTLKGIKLGRVKRLSDGTFGIRVEFENDLMYHPSIFPSTGTKGHSFMLISSGWNTGKKSTKLSRRLGRQVYRFTYFEGADLIGQIIKEYNSKKMIGIDLTVNWSGNYVK